jgi:hypothetical protein
MNPLKHNYQNLFSKWLLAAALVISFFTFSGLAVKTNAITNVPQTRLVQSGHSAVVKSITYKRALSFAQNKRYSSAHLILSTVKLSEIHSILLKTQIINLCSFNAGNPQISLFYQHKIIPQNTGDEPAVNLV